MVRRIILFIAAASFALPAAGETYMGVKGFIRPQRQSLDLEYQARAEALRKEMVALQNRDGGSLTGEDRAYLQSKLDALLGSYRRDLTAIDPMSLNADGTRVR